LENAASYARENALGDTRWRSHDSVIAVLLFLGTAAFVLWQNSQIAVLWDLSYLLDTSWRIALGQAPYRDFPLVHPPLTFLIQALLMRVAGRVYLIQIGYAGLVGGLGTVIAWRVVYRVLAGSGSGPVRWAWMIALLLAAPLCVVGVYSIYPHPIYDCDCAFSILIAVFCLQCAGDASSSGGLRAWVHPGLAGAACVAPVFFKQNMGLPFLLAVVAGALFLLVLRRFRSFSEPRDYPDRSAGLLRFLAAIVVVLLGSVALLQATVGLNNYVHWTVQFAGQRRLPGLGDMLAVYVQPSFVWTLPSFAAGLILLYPRWAARLWVRLCAAVLLGAPFVGSLVYLFLNDDLDERGDNLLALWPLLLLVSGAFAIAELRKGITLCRLLPFFILAAIHGTFLSQQLWGSTYAIWPLLMILVAYILAALPSGAGWVKAVLAAAIGATFLVCGGLYALGHERLNYIQIPNAALQWAVWPALRGMADRGPFLPDFEELLRFAEAEIPARDGLLLIPGEDPFYFATGRVPVFPVLLFDRTTDPYSAEQLMDEVRRRGIRWVIVKTRLQSNESALPEPEKTLELVQREFVLYRKLSGYDVYLRR
jgi:hypothetical protein